MGRLSHPGHPRRALIAGAALICGASLLAVADAAPAAASPTIRYANTPQAVGGQYIVVFRDDRVTTSSVESTSRALASQYGAALIRNYRATLRGFAARMTESQALRLASNSAVAYVAQDQRVSVRGSQVSPPWGLDRLDQKNLPLSGGYTYPTGARPTHAYVIDTGVRITHVEFRGRASYGRDFVDNDATADDCHGHGTHVSGTIAGTTYGVSKNALIVGVRVLDCSGSGYYSGVIAGVDWVTSNAIKPAVANMSLGGGAYSPLDDAVTRSIASGVSYAVAAGNNNADACQASPARTPNAITVGATGSYSYYPPAADVRASFSNYGICLDVFAPGVGIRSALNTSDSAWAEWSGTSMASPHVAGVIAQFLSVNPTATPVQVRTAIVGAASSGILNSGSLGAGSPDKLLYTPTTGIPMPVASPICASGRNAVSTRIPDVSSISSRIVISCSGNASVTSAVSVKITHPYRGDLELRLVGPNAVVYQLKTPAKADNAANVDETYVVNLAASPRTGTWTLQVYNRYAGDIGTLVNWSLAL